MKLADRVTALLGVLALLSVTAMVLTAGDYLRGTEAARDFVIEVSNLELTEEPSPEISVALRIQNRSPLTVELDRVHFSIYLNRNFVASNYGGFEKVTLAGLEEQTLDFDIPLQPFYLRYIEEAREQEEFSWVIRGRGKLILVFRESEIWLNISGRWKGT